MLQVSVVQGSEANVGPSSANPSTIQDKLLVGYQGWLVVLLDVDVRNPHLFVLGLHAPGTVSPSVQVRTKSTKSIISHGLTGHHGWLHWFNSPIPNGGRPNVDLWPDTSEYDPSELYPAPGLTTRSGDPVHLFSSRNPKTVRRHFHWMALHGVDGAFLQRFANECEIKPGNHGLRDLRDEVGDRVREAAEAEGRVFTFMYVLSPWIIHFWDNNVWTRYDVSGAPPDKIQIILEHGRTFLPRVTCSTRIQRAGAGITCMDTPGRGTSP